MTRGRRATLPLAERLAVCGRFRTAWDAVRFAKARISDPDIEDARAQLNSIPVQNRSNLSLDHRELLDWLRDGLDERGRVVTAKTPQGQREALLARFAAEESTKRGVEITPRMIKRWLIEYDEFCRD